MVLFGFDELGLLKGVVCLLLFFVGSVLILRCVSLHSQSGLEFIPPDLASQGCSVHHAHTQLAFVFPTLSGTLENPSLLNATFILLVIYFTAV